MWHDVPNRGGNITLHRRPARAGDIGLCSGWQGDNAGATRGPGQCDCLRYVAPVHAPVTNDWVKMPVLAGTTGKIFGRIINRSGSTQQPLNVMGNPIPYFPAKSTDNAGAVAEDASCKETINGKVTWRRSDPEQRLEVLRRRRPSRRPI